MATPVPALPRTRQVELTANAVYGTILAAATMSVISEKVYDDSLKLSVQVLTTLVVFWLAHTFALGMAERATPGGDSHRRDIKEQLATTSPMVAAAVPLLVPLLLADIGLFSTDAGLWISYLLAIAILTGWGYVSARRRHLTPRGTVLEMLASGGLGLLLITLKEIVH